MFVCLRSYGAGNEYRILDKAGCNSSGICRFDLHFQGGWRIYLEGNTIGEIVSKGFQLATSSRILNRHSGDYKNPFVTILNDDSTLLNIENVKPKLI